jgi:hypothetical protein
MQININHQVRVDGCGIKSQIFKFVFTYTFIHLYTFICIYIHVKKHVYLGKYGCLWHGVSFQGLHDKTATIQYDICIYEGMKV